MQSVKRTHIESNLYKRKYLQCCIGTAPFPDLSSSFLESEERKAHFNTKKGGRPASMLSCTLNSSSISSSSQLSFHSLSPSDFAAPGATPPRCARSVWESSQSKQKKTDSRIFFVCVNAWAAQCSPWTTNSSNSSS